jgi:GNAT superfamily N-acetyltransferase
VSGKPLILRDARREDVPIIVRMLVDDPLGSTRERYEEPLPQAYYDAFEATANDPNNRHMIAEVDGNLVGTLHLVFIRGVARMGATRAQIEAVRIAAGQRGEGIGRKMIEAAIEMARERGCSLVQLTTDKTRKDAHRFYESLGFVASHEGMKLSLT